MDSPSAILPNSGHTHQLPVFALHSEHHILIQSLKQPVTQTNLPLTLQVGKPHPRANDLLMGKTSSALPRLSLFSPQRQCLILNLELGQWPSSPSDPPVGFKGRQLYPALHSVAGIQAQVLMLPLKQANTHAFTISPAAQFTLKGEQWTHLGPSPKREALVWLAGTLQREEVSSACLFS